jgi:hypothetical protein
MRESDWVRDRENRRNRNKRIREGRRRRQEEMKVLREGKMIIVSRVYKTHTVCMKDETQE